MVCVCKIVAYRKIDAIYPDRCTASRKSGKDPVFAWRGGEAVPEHTDGEEDGKYAGSVEAAFGARVVGTGDIDGGDIFDKNGEDVPHDGPNDESYKVQVSAPACTRGRGLFGMMKVSIFSYLGIPIRSV